MAIGAMAARPSAHPQRGHRPRRPRPAISMPSAQRPNWTDVELKPSYVNDSALGILTYPNKLKAPKSAATIQGQLRTILQAERVTEPVPPISFLSGSRRYVCRSLLLKPWRGTSPLTVALLLERQLRTQAALSEASWRYRLSPREAETVQHLVLGLTTKEIAQRMNVSANTVKHFVRLVMCKVGGTTRTGIVGAILACRR